ncbi:MAG TPA: hypothetical protein VGL64_24050 [Amycolatopsis sp.]
MSRTSELTLSPSPSRSATGIRSFTGNTFDRIGAQSGAVVAYLDGHKKHWNDVRIDSAQVHAVGFSNGGQMVIRLIHEVPSAAILSATQSVPENFAPDAPQQQPLPVLLVHGPGGPDCPHRTPPPITHGATASPPRPPSHPRACRRKWTAPSTVSRATSR